MAFSIQNSETGEMNYIHRHMCSVKHQNLDMETGEPLNGTQLKVRYVKHDNFHIPKKYLRGTQTEEMDKTIAGLYDEESLHTDIHVKLIPVDRQSQEKCAKQYKKEDFLNMDGVKNDILLGYTKEAYLLFLIPTLFCFTMTLSFILLAIEDILHCWAHKKNVLNMNKSFYFRSPLHLLTSQFCAVCRCENEIEMIQMLNRQMRKARQSKTLRDVSKVIS